MSDCLISDGCRSLNVQDYACSACDLGRFILLRKILLNRIGIVLLLSSFFLVVSCASTRFEMYQERTAVASWYGAEFHGRLTASGERFDMFALTCAHRELPFGSVLEVKNVVNEKTVKCVVNDRGPFVSGRDIDMSYAAAKEIGLVSMGTAPVRITYVGREAGYVKEVKFASSGGPYTVQVGSFTERENALRLKSGLELKYKEVYIVEAMVKGVNYYRVRIGKFYKKGEAFSVGKVLADEGYSPVITHYDTQA